MEELKAMELVVEEAGEVLVEEAAVEVAKAGMGFGKKALIVGAVATVVALACVGYKKHKAKKAAAEVEAETSEVTADDDSEKESTDSAEE